MEAYPPSKMKRRKSAGQEAYPPSNEKEKELRRRIAENKCNPVLFFLVMHRKNASKMFTKKMANTFKTISPAKIVNLTGYVRVHDLKHLNFPTIFLPYPLPFFCSFPSLSHFAVR